MGVVDFVKRNFPGVKLAKGLWKAGGHLKRGEWGSALKAAGKGLVDDWSLSLFLGGAGIWLNSAKGLAWAAGLANKSGFVGKTINVLKGYGSSQFYKSPLFAAEVGLTGMDMLGFLEDKNTPPQFQETPGISPEHLANIGTYAMLARYGA